jgi:2-polyprenyl-3-methyl-5-hydroxy-6-metoxy-1,4-benzoquinol methylase
MKSSDQLNPKYESYKEWKGWHELFNPSAQEKALFEKEFCSLILSSKKFLDFGFGSGALLAWAKSKGSDVTGIEVQGALIAAAKEINIPAHASTKHLNDNVFDVISFFDVLEHVPIDEIHELLQEAYRIAKTGCTLIIRVPNCQSPAGLANQFADPTHVSMLSGPILKAFLEDAHFKNIYVREAHLQPSSNSLNRLLRILSKPLIYCFEAIYRLTWSVRQTPLSCNVIIVANK